MPAEIQPIELARLVDLAERPRVQDWSLRAALVRYAQPEPQRVNDILDLVRRTEWAIGKQSAYIARNGEALWDALSDDSGNAARDVDAHVVGILRIAQQLDHFGDVLAGWAVDRRGNRPDAEADRVIEDVGHALDTLNVPQQERPPGPRNRG